MAMDLDIRVVREDTVLSEGVAKGWSRFVPSIAFYARTFGIVVTGSRLAKKGRYGDREWVISSYDTVRALEHSGVRMDVSGVENLTATEGPVVIIGNHMSTLETFVLPYLVAPLKPVTFVIKKALVDYPIFKHIMRSRDPIVVGRQSPKEDLRTVMDEGCKRLEKGISVIVFPQTTRSEVFDPEQFNSIGVKLAKKARVPVIPLALKTDAWRNGRMVKEFGRIDPSRAVHFAFGKALSIEGNGSAQQEAVIAHIQEQLGRWV
jgi:1-acyl-sn-glycerol-3-phosphate acyltransferase